MFETGYAISIFFDDRNVLEMIAAIHMSTAIPISTVRQSSRWVCIYRITSPIGCSSAPRAQGGAVASTLARLISIY